LADFDEAAVAIVTRFDATLLESHPSVARIYDNQHAEPQAASASWIRLSIIGGGANMPEIGSRMADELGRAIAQIFTPVGIGDSLARQIASSVRDALQGIRIGEVQLYATEISSVPTEPGSPWRQLNASTRFRFESTPA